MNSVQAPTWSFLAVEPEVQTAMKKNPQIVRQFVEAKTTLARRHAFWVLYGQVERLVAQSKPQALVAKRRLIIQTFYALIDLSALEPSKDRDVQRWLDGILVDASADIPGYAAVSAHANVHVA